MDATDRSIAQMAQGRGKARSASISGRMRSEEAAPRSEGIFPERSRPLRMDAALRPAFPSKEKERITVGNEVRLFPSDGRCSQEAPAEIELGLAFADIAQIGSCCQVLHPIVIARPEVQMAQVDRSTGKEAVGPRP